MTSPPTPIVHLTTRAVWDAAGTTYVPEGFADEGFVHCSSPQQVADVAEARFADRDDLVLLTIDPTQLSSPVVWEDLTGEGRDHPHVYGPIERHAVIAVRPYRRGDDGRFPRPL